MMLGVVVGVLAGLLMVAGILVMLGPNTKTILRRLRSLRRARTTLSVFATARPHEVSPSGPNPKTQRVLEGASRLAAWLRAHNHEDLARELRHAAGRMTGDEPTGLYAMQTLLRRLRSLNMDDRVAQERLKALSNELRTAVQDRFEQLELLPFRKG